MGIMSNMNFLENEVIEFKKTTGELKEGIISIVSILRIFYIYQKI